MKIVLICYAGMSTSLVMKKMEEAALKDQIKIEITAASASDLDEHKEGADIILLGPQVRFMLDEVKQKVGAEIPVMVIDLRDYGMMRGDVILKNAMKAIAENKK